MKTFVVTEVSGFTISLQGEAIMVGDQGELVIGRLVFEHGESGMAGEHIFAAGQGLKVVAKVPTN